jgi:hypothetical protein
MLKSPLGVNKYIYSVKHSSSFASKIKSISTQLIFLITKAIIKTYLQFSSLSKIILHIIFICSLYWRIF